MRTIEILSKISDLDKEISKLWKDIQKLEAAGEDPHGPALSQKAEIAWKLCNERDFWSSFLSENRYNVRQDIGDINLS